MSLTFESVVKQLTDSGIIAPGRLESFLPPRAHPAGVDDLVDKLLNTSTLTPFQAEQVKAGRATELVLGDYTLLDRIGSGGMGQVFKAEHRLLKRLVAVKMPPPGISEASCALT